MNQVSEEHKQIPTRAYIKIGMVFSVFIFGLLIPYNLMIEVNYNLLFWAMGLGTFPMFYIFILVRKELWNLPFDINHKGNFFKLLVWAFLFSSILYTPLLLLNKIGSQKFSTQATVIKVANFFIGRDYIHPHLTLQIDDSIVKIRMSREELEGFTKGKRVIISGVKGSLGVITEAQVK